MVRIVCLAFICGVVLFSGRGNGLLFCSIDGDDKQASYLTSNVYLRLDQSMAADNVQSSTCKNR